MAHKRIDFIGPPGSGKSTLIHSIVSAQDNFLDRNTAIQKILTENFKKKKFSVKDYLKMGVEYFDKQGRAIGIDNDLIREYLIDRGYINEKVFNYALESLSQQPDISVLVKSKRIQLLFDVLRDNLLIKDYRINKKQIIFDDSLSNMLFLTVFPMRCSIDEILDNYDLTILNQHLPDVVIYLYTDEEALYSRIKKRKRINTSHLGLTTEQLKESLAQQVNIYQKTAEFLKILNVPILNINTEEVKTICGDKINTFIDLNGHSE